ncbi:MAG: hypothetical protein ACRD44_11970 [Bryobacteraceae bacterium]
MPPFLSRATDTQSPSLRLACLAMASGIRIARLFPHFETVVSFRMSIYFEYTFDSGRVLHLAMSRLPGPIRMLGRSAGVDGCELDKLTEKGDAGPALAAIKALR